MKTPVTYYGGKQSLLKHILPYIPPHSIYVEPFAGGAAVYWAKVPAKVEVLNDTNTEVINFYRVVQLQLKPLQKEIEATLHSREQFRQAKVVYQNPDLFDPIKRAWAFWVLSCQSYSSSLGCGWRHCKGIKVTRDTTNRKAAMRHEISVRLANTQIECRDALTVIQQWDSPDTFFYIDPPYFNANMGHYGGYTEEDFRQLLEVLSTLQGKFLLSSYPSAILSRYIRQNGWKVREVHRNLGMRKEGRRSKVEVLTANYEYPGT